MFNDSIKFYQTFSMLVIYKLSSTKNRHKNNYSIWYFINAQKCLVIKMYIESVIAINVQIYTKNVKVYC